MIIIECDNCERTFEAREEDAGSKVACPYCGDINRVPESAPSAPSDPARATALREDDDLPPDHGPEQHICHVRPAMFRAHPFRALPEPPAAILQDKLHFCWGQQPKDILCPAVKP